MLFGQYARSAAQRGLSFTLTKEQFRTLTKTECDYCGTAPGQVYAGRKGMTNGDYVYNGVDRVDNTRGYEPDNVVASCGDCNIAKASMTVKQFFAWVERVYRRRVAQ